MVNVENFTKLADRIEASNTFTMRLVVWGRSISGKESREFLNKHPCGTPACILGHGYALLTNRDIVIYDEVKQIDIVERWLGITREQGSELFMPYHLYANYTSKQNEPGYITKKKAVKHLRAIAKVGKFLDWPFK